MRTHAQILALLAASALSLAATGSAWADLAGATPAASAPAATQPMPAAPTALPRDLSLEQRPLADLKPPVSTLAVSAWVDHQDNTYRVGELLKLSVKSNEDAYITVLNVGTSGKTHIIFPNQYQPDSRVRAGQTVVIPSGSDTFDLKVGGPAGTELLKIIATRSPNPLFAPQSMEPAGPFKALKGTAASIAKDLTVALRDQPQGWAEYDKIIRIVDAAAAAPLAPQQTVMVPAPVAVQGMGAVSALQQPAPAAPGGFTLTLAADKALYKPGELAELLVSTTRDCRLYVVDVGTSGQATLLFPNKWQQDTRIRAGQTIRLGAADGPTALRVSGPEGLEALMAICRADDGPVLSSQPNWQAGPYAPLGSAASLAKNLEVVLRQPASAVAHAATSFLIGQ